MNQSDIFMPVCALAALTFLVLIDVPIRRFASSFRGWPARDDYTSGECDRVPPSVSIPNRNLMNLLEMPILFYVVSVCLFVTQGVTPMLMNLAWVYVGLRAAHSLVHLTFNHVIVRLSV